MCIRDSIHTQNIPVILLSMLDKQISGLESAIDYLQKPVDWDKLSETLEQLIPETQHGKLLLVDKKSSERDVLINTLNKNGWQVNTSETREKSQSILEQQTINALLLSENIFQQDDQPELNTWLESIKPLILENTPIIVMGNSETALEQHIEDVAYVLRQGFNANDIIAKLNHQNKDKTA